MSQNPSIADLFLFAFPVLVGMFLAVFRIDVLLSRSSRSVFNHGHRLSSRTEDGMPVLIDPDGRRVTIPADAGIRRGRSSLNGGLNRKKTLRSTVDWVWEEI